MRSDLDRLMKQRGLSGLVVLALDRYSPAFYYATGQKIHHGFYVRAADGRAHLVHDPMERDQAAAVGCGTSSYAQRGYLQRVKSADSQAPALAELMVEVAGEMGLSGRIAFTGDAPLGYGWRILDHVRRIAPAIEVDAEQPDILSEASTTKSEDELEKIRHCSRGAVEAMKRVRDELGSLRRNGSGFVTTSGESATLGHLRRLLHRTFAEFALGEDGESIVAQGRDAGVPHNRGNDADPIRAGEPILVDIFPGEAGGGYHTDMTRTFCLGPAPEPLRLLYASAARRSTRPWRAHGRASRAATSGTGVRRVRTPGPPHRARESGHRAGVRARTRARRRARRARGPAPRRTAHEHHEARAGPRRVRGARALLSERGLGVRIEDLVAVRADGGVENLTPAPYELEVPIRS
jgi:Xaa-Pro aminopeptidase